jgi:hypothetical protein
MTLNARGFVCIALLAAICRAGLPTDVPAGWQTYRSTDYGFTIGYPASMLFYSGHPDHNCDITTVACFYYNRREDPQTDGTNFSYASLSINVLRDRRTKQDCDKIDSLLHPPPKTETINGIKFRYGITGDAWTSHYKGGPTYRTFHQNVCFEIAVGIEEVSTGAFDPGTIKTFDSAKLERLLDEMVHTFKFAGTVKDGPAWKVYLDSICGGVFEYPEGDTVQRTIEPSNARFDSNEITCSQYFTHHGLDYTVAVKANLKDKARLESWLKSSGYPDLSKASVIARSKYYTEYKAEPYYYIFGQASVYILSVSDAKHRVIVPHDDRVFSHLLGSFKAY